MKHPIFLKKYSSRDTFSGKLVHMYGWSHIGKGVGIFDSYISALASYMNLWEEYCAYYRSIIEVKANGGSE